MSDMIPIDTSPEALERLAEKARSGTYDIHSLADLLDTIAAEKRAGPDGGWNYDMSAAPRDGTRVDLWINGNRITEAYMRDGHWHCHATRFSTSNAGDLRICDDPTAWRHLPAPPAKQE